MFEFFTDKAIAVVMIAQQETRRLGHSFVGTEQLLLGLIGEGTSIAAQVLSEMGLTLENVQAEVEKAIGRGGASVPAQIPLTPKTKRVLEQAFQESRNLDYQYIGPEHLLLSLTKHRDSVAAKILENLGIDLDIVRANVIRALGDAASVPAGGMPRSGRSDQSSRSNALEQFGADLTQQAADGKIDPVIGRQREVERVVQILGRRTKNNPVLIGEPGVGKTAIAEGLAQRIIDHAVPELLINKRIIRLDMGLLIGGTRFRGDFEERIKQVMNEVRQDPNIILVIDEIHTLVGAGAMEGGMDAANLLKPALARGDLQCIGATTLDEYRKHIERDAALERRFQPVAVNEPTIEETIEILHGLRGRYEQHHNLTIADEALDAAAKLSDRYISDRFLPDKAIDLIDEAGSRVRLRSFKKLPTQDLTQELRQIRQQKDAAVATQDFDRATQLRDQELDLEAKVAAMHQVTHPLDSAQPQPLVTSEDIAQVVAAWTGIPVNRLTDSESALLLHLEDELHERLIGQHEAVTAVARSIRRSRVGLSSPDRPIASLFFSGPTGVGKTELTKALAASVFGSEEAMIRLDMSEYMERHTISKLIGSPPGFVGYDEGGQLTEAVRRQPYAVILFDEIEKAHPDIFNTLLQILDDGRLTDAKGRVVSFKNTVLIMTSNIGSRVIEKGAAGLGFQFADDSVAEMQYNRIRNLVNEELKQYFRPEFLNRLDEVIVFRQLSRDEVTQISELLLQEVTARLGQQGIGLELTAAFKERLVLEGYDARYGARPLRRAIARLVEDNLAEALLSHQIQAGDIAMLDVDDDGQVKVAGRSSRELVSVGSR